ncbi:putative bifunctional diguanylate cyclase/phosphodiesterase [Salinibius halmophilus]|uniref:putative bifunctional diguanylate cyclase/phosphodiesterase n=1 Tax=Salinibius halmophilus TaxID=1853216 RepID=UPI000E65F5D9|nr:bifunctional diguanylate cyclase/phosphodiesterase [Salinibius halmophilus]
MTHRLALAAFVFSSIFAAFMLWYLPMHSYWLVPTAIVLLLLLIFASVWANNTNKVAQLPRQNPLPVLVVKADGNLIFANPSANMLACRLFGEEASAADLLPSALLTSIRNGNIPTTSPIFQIDQYWYRFLLAQSDTKECFCYLEDVTESEERRLKLEYMAYHDPVTNLGNRAMLLEKIEQLADEDHYLTLVLVAIESLDEAASVQGLPATEHYLTILAENLARIFSSVIKNIEVTTVRFNGYEFGALFPCELSDAQKHLIEEQLIALLGRPQSIANRDYWLNYYIGMAGTNPKNAEHLPRRAHVALYSGRANDQRFQCYDVHLEQLIAERARLEQALSQAITNNELALHYQAQISINDNHLVGFESLMRWQHEGKMVSPGIFIPIAERHGLIRELGEWAIDETCRTLAKWLQEGHQTMIAVNVSAQQFIDPNFARIVRQAISKYQVPPSCLQLEITESLLMEDEQQSLRLMRELKALGVSLAIDDFGTGYSSFAYLSRFPVDKLKIDRSFILGLSKGPKDEAIVAAMLDVGEKLGMQVIAEGVEHDHEISKLKRLNCQLVQGFYFSKPLPSEQAIKLFDEY